MARILNPVLGNISGKAGNSTFYTREGDTYMATRPEHYNIKSENLKKAQGKFGAINRFTKPVYKEQLIAEMWKKASPRKSYRYQFFVSHNADKFTDNRPTKFNIISPPGTESPISELCYEMGKIKVKLLQETEGQIILIMVPINKINGDPLTFEVIRPVVKDIPSKEFIIDLPSFEVTKIKEYSEYIIYGTVVDKDEWTNSIAFEGKVY